MSEFIEVAHKDSIQVVRMTRPEKKNALTLDMYAAMADALDAGDKDPNVAVQLLAGGPDFSAGNDLADFLKLTTLTGTPTERFLKAVSSTQKPLIAAVAGAAVGIGSTMLLHCDMVLCAGNARFQFPFINLGLVPEAASTLLLPRLAGSAKAAELLLLGEPFGAETALQIGMVNAIHQAETLEDAAWALALKLAAKPRQGMAWTKALLKAEPEPMRERILREARMFEDCLKTAELKEAVAAFREKRAPDFAKCR
ncbi:MAG TPA: enoyl-CoA hydratase-related protein [Candidatus Sulfotelmatobacter sp.]|jgi:enoyl-CoA hydratase/carnithine racemase|nr:enoyl-CoA hydratase-related protein [Candidatus Sulfotelmatobacter sp.]